MWGQGASKSRAGCGLLGYLFLFSSSQLFSGLFVGHNIQAFCVKGVSVISADQLIDLEGL